jgi:hypothetical protein
VWRPDFHDRAFFDHVDHVGVGDGVQRVGDDEGGASLDQFAYGVLDETLGLGVERCGRLVQQDDGRIADQGPGHSDALALAAGVGRWHLQMPAGLCHSRVASATVRQRPEATNGKFDVTRVEFGECCAAPLT